MFLGSWPPPCDVWKQKTQILNAHQKVRNRLDQKKFPSRQKKGPLGFRGFRTCFLLLTTPYVMFESKKPKFLLLIRRKELIGPKKFPSSQKKGPLGVRGFLTCFGEVDHPLCDVWKQITQILIAHQKARNRLDQKKFPSSQKKVS